MTRTVGRRRADDAGAVAARRARQHEPAARRTSTGPRFDVGADHLRGLRIGLLLDAGCGLAGGAGDPRGGRARGAPVRARRRHRRADAALHDAGHARRHGPFLAHALARRHERAAARTARARCCPTSAQWADSAAGFSGEHVFRAFSQFHATRVAAVAACATFDYVISPTVAQLPAPRPKLPSPTNDPLRPLEHIGFTVPFNMSEQPAASINCGYTQRRPADRPADRRPALRRPGRAAGGARLRADPRTAAALAAAAVGRHVD